MPHPEIEPADDVETSPIHFNRVVPVYPGFERHEQRALRELAFRIADKYAASIEEPLPDALRTPPGPASGWARRSSTSTFRPATRSSTRSTRTPRPRTSGWPSTSSSSCSWAWPCAGRA